MGVPWFAIPLILSGSETLEMELLDGGDGARTKTITGNCVNLKSDILKITFTPEHPVFVDFVTSEHTYKFNTWWNMTYGRGMGTMWNFCTKEDFNVILCK